MASGDSDRIVYIPTLPPSPAGESPGASTHM